MAVGIFAELVVLSSAKRFGYDLIAIALTDQPRARRLMAAVMAATAVRWFMSALAPSEGVFLAVQLLHGLTFGAFILLAVGRMLVLVPESLRATGQALLLSAVVGVGSTFGSLLAGRMAEYRDTAFAFEIGGCAVVVALVFFLLTSRDRSAHGVRGTS
jgi:PPP family 3-phenylpropionic acid transporter